MQNNNLSIVRQQFAQCVFNHKMHEKACDRLGSLQNRIKWVNVLLLFFVLIFIILQLKFPKYYIFSGISLGISVFEILFFITQKEFFFEARIVTHKKTAHGYMRLRDKYKNFIVDIYNEIEVQETVTRRDLLQEQYQFISDSAPQTNGEDYTKAQKSLLGKTNSDEEYTWSDEEIDRFLPNELRITNPT